MTHVFISYVSEDEDIVRLICTVMRANDVEYWLDRESIDPGERWKAALERAIASGSHFLFINSVNSVQRESSVANEELVLAIEQIRMRPHDAKWFFALKTDSAPVPVRPIGAGETLADLQWIDVPALGWRESIFRLLKALGIENPVLDPGEPLGAGYPSSMAIRSGKVVYEGADPPVPGFAGTVYTVTGGEIRRDNSGEMLARLFTQAGHERIQATNERIGAADIFAYSQDAELSRDPENPNTFKGVRNGRFSRGEVLFQPSVGEVTLPVDVEFTGVFEGVGHLKGDFLTGTFEAVLEFSFGGQIQRQVQTGYFEVTLESHRR